VLKGLPAFAYITKRTGRALADDEEIRDTFYESLYRHLSASIHEDWAKLTPDEEASVLFKIAHHGDVQSFNIAKFDVNADSEKWAELSNALGKIIAISENGNVTLLNYDVALGALLETRRKVDLSVTSVIIPERKVAEGVLVKATSLVWTTVLEELEKQNWQNVHEIPPRIWEEMIAGAFVKAGFDEVVLTPRSADHGRDVIAIRKGVGSIKILDSVKAYKPGHLVTKEEVHALMGVLAVDPNASKGILTTTSDFAPRLLEDTRLAQTVPHRIELMNGTQLREWLNELAKKK
jgi:restriction system protein